MQTIEGLSGMADRAELVMCKLAAFFADRQGATAIEYGLVIALISSALILGLEGIRDHLIAVLRILSDTFANAIS